MTEISWRTLFEELHCPIAGMGGGGSMHHLQFRVPSNRSYELMGTSKKYVKVIMHKLWQNLCLDYALYLLFTFLNFLHKCIPTTIPKACVLQWRQKCQF